MNSPGAFWMCPRALCFFITMAKIESSITLNLIPMMRSNNRLVKPGQVCRACTAAISFYTAMSYEDMYYTNIEGEQPMSETDIIDSGRTNAVTGYGGGINNMHLRSGSVMWKPMNILKFISMAKLAKKPIINEDPMPVLLKEDPDGELMFDVETGAEATYSAVKGIELLVNTKAECAWAGINWAAYSKRLREALRKYMIGWSAGTSDADVVTLDAIKPGALSLFKIKSDTSRIASVLNSRAINILPY